MYLIAIGWLYVAVMMSVAEATNSNGSILGAIFTFILYGLLPTALVVYVLSAPARKRKRKAREAEEHAQWLAAQASSSSQPDAGGETPADTVPAVRKEP